MPQGPRGEAWTRARTSSSPARPQQPGRRLLSSQGRVPCLVLDARHIPGGGASTEDCLLPGFGIDTCATGHTLIRANPLLTRDELGLIADFGLRYVDPDPVAHVTFPDGEYLTMWLDRDRTAAEIARFAPADATAYLRMLDEYDEVKSIFSGSQFTPVGFGASLEERLAEHPRGRRVAAAMRPVGLGHHPA